MTVPFSQLNPGASPLSETTFPRPTSYFTIMVVVDFFTAGFLAGAFAGATFLAAGFLVSVWKN
jgi:hypothetical protein